LCDSRQLRDDVLKLQFIRQQVVGPEAAVRFGQILDELPEFPIAEPVRQRLGDRVEEDGGAARARQQRDRQERRRTNDAGSACGAILT